MLNHEHILNIHERKAQDALTRIADLFNSGDISFEADLLQGITQEYVQFFNNLAKPTITPEPLVKDSLLYVSAIRNPMVQLDNDLNVSYAQLSRLVSAAKMMSNICSTERSGLASLMEEAYASVDGARLWASDSDTNFMWSSDTFKTIQKINYPASTARIATDSGVVTLAVESEETLLPKIANVVIAHSGLQEKYANGLPGNSLEVKNIGWSANPEQIKEPISPVFTGTTYQDSANPYNMFDSEHNTWFEWEKYLVPAAQSTVSAGSAVVAGQGGARVPVIGPTSQLKDYGWYHTVRWPDADGTESRHWIITPWGSPEISPSGEDVGLTLELHVDFTDAQELSWLELTPYLATSADNRSSQPAKLMSVLVSPNGSDGWVQLVKRPDGIYMTPDLRQPINYSDVGIPVKDHKGIAVLPCPIRQVKSIKIQLAQDTPYKTKIGHQFFIKKSKVDQRSGGLLGIGESKKLWEMYTRVPNEGLNTFPTSIKKKLNLGIMTGFAVSPTPAAGLLFGLLSRNKTTVTDIEVKSYYDILEAYRYCIGIRELGLYKRVYSETGTLLSKAHTFKTPVRTATLVVSEQIPDGWDRQTDWVTYQLSPDGTTWYDTVPQNTGGTESTVVRFDTPTKTVFTRITLRRPENRPTESPIINYYAIKALP